MSATKQAERIGPVPTPIRSVVMLGNSIAAGSRMNGAGFFRLLEIDVRAKPGMEHVEFSNRTVPAQTVGEVEAPIVTNPQFATMDRQVNSQYGHLGSDSLSGTLFLVSPSLIDAMLSPSTPDVEFVNAQTGVLMSPCTFRRVHEPQSTTRLDLGE